MNFLAHYHTTKPDIEAYKLLGVLLPDMVKNFTKLYNHQIENDFSSNVKEIQQMLEGIKLHMKGDDCFHNHSIFLDLESRAKDILVAQEEISVQRKFIIAHVLVELMIDQYIVNNHPKSVDLLYEKLETVDMNSANLFFEALNTSENVTHFKQNFSNFMRIKFLYKLKENEGLIFTLNIVFGKLLDYDFMVQKELWNDIIEKIKENLSLQTPVLLDELKTKLYE